MFVIPFKSSVEFSAVNEWRTISLCSGHCSAGQDLYEADGYAMWYTAGGAICIAHYDVIDDVIARKL